MDILASRDTVTIDESVHHIYKDLTEGADPVTVPFKTMKDVFLWAAVLGCKRGERRPIVGKKVTVFRWAQFSVQTDAPVIKAICLADGSDVDVLLNQDQMLGVVEEYANAGIHELKTRLTGGYGQPLFNLVELQNG